MTTGNEIATISPVFVTKSENEYPREVPIIMLGGSPHIVAAPPKFAQNISARIIEIGLNLSSCESSIVTAAKNKITVILSMNIARNEDSIINVRYMETTL